MIVEKYDESVIRMQLTEIARRKPAIARGNQVVMQFLTKL